MSIISELIANTVTTPPLTTRFAHTTSFMRMTLKGRSYFGPCVIFTDDPYVPTYDKRISYVRLHVDVAVNNVVLMSATKIDIRKIFIYFPDGYRPLS